MLFIKFTFAYVTKMVLIRETHEHFQVRQNQSREFSRVGRFTHALFCLYYMLAYVGTIGTIGKIGIANGIICKTLTGICLPLVKTPNARTGFDCRTSLDLSFHKLVIYVMRTC